MIKLTLGRILVYIALISVSATAINHSDIPASIGYIIALLFKFAYDKACDELDKCQNE